MIYMNTIRYDETQLQMNSTISIEVGFERRFYVRE